jgi:hypothetical protein
MSSYKFGKQNTSSKDDRSRFRLWTKVFIITALILVPVIVYVIVTTLPPSPVTGKTIEKGKFDPYTTVTTDWFSFRVENTWEEVPDITVKDQVYVYREKQGANPQGLLSIYVNSAPKGFEDFFTRVVPITLKEDGASINSLPMQPHCDEAVTPVVQQNHMVTQGDTTFYCWAGGRVLYAIAGEVGDDTKLELKREDGSTATYTITYRNLAFSPNEGTFPKVLATFKSR